MQYGEKVGIVKVEGEYCILRVFEEVANNKKELAYSTPWDGVGTIYGLKDFQLSKVTEEDLSKMAYCIKTGAYGNIVGLIQLQDERLIRIKELDPFVGDVVEVGSTEAVQEVTETQSEDIEACDVANYEEYLECVSGFLEV